MEDIIEEFGSGFLAIAGTFGFWYENMGHGGVIYEFVRQFLICTCGS